MTKGTVFNLNESQGDWFDFFESEIDLESGKVTYADPEPGTGRVCVRSSRPLILERAAKVKRKAEFVLNPKTRQMERVEYVKAKTPEEIQEEGDELTDYIITGFDRVFDHNGDEIKCTKENKIKLAAIPVFDRFLARCMELQANASSAKVEKIRKNLPKP